MNVLHIIDHLGFGGAQMVVKGIIENQEKKDNMYLFSLRKNLRNSVKINHVNSKIGSTKSKYGVKSFFELIKFIKRKKITMIHCHLLKSIFYGWVIKQFYFKKINFIVHEHGKIIGGGYYTYLLRLIKSKVDLFIGVSKQIVRLLVKEIGVPKKKCIFLYNYIELNKFNQKKSTKKINKNKIYTIGYVGRLSKLKGCEYLIKALPHIKFNYECIIVGDGKEKDYLKNLTKKLNLTKNVKFLGFKEDVQNYYSLFDVLVIPSLRESFGITVIEAQASGVPVICSNIDGLSEIIIDTQNGLLFKSKDSFDLSKKILQVHEDNELKNKLINVGLIKSKLFNLNNYLKSLNSIYNEGCNEK